MASAFGHAAASIALSQTGLISKPDWKLLFLGIFVSVFPDADAIGFALGVPYNSFWGHRGFSHSIAFALILAGFITWFYRNQSSRRKAGVFAFLFLSCISHAILDAMTTGGLGVAFFAPFNNKRYFLPFRPIKVSPISVKAFFEGKGWTVIKSEAIWIGVPAAAIIATSLLTKRIKRSIGKRSEKERQD
jgi:inner membrane protein